MNSGKRTSAFGKVVHPEGRQLRQKVCLAIGVDDHEVLDLIAAGKELTVLVATAERSRQGIQCHRYMGSEDDQGHIRLELRGNETWQQPEKVAEESVKRELALVG